MPNTTHDDNATNWRDLLPIPAGATVDDWNQPDWTGFTSRAVLWSKHDAAGVGVAVDGWQSIDGELTRGISLYDTECKELTADDARALAAALLAAADALDRLL